MYRRKWVSRTFNSRQELGTSCHGRAPFSFFFLFVLFCLSLSLSFSFLFLIAESARIYTANESRPANRRASSKVETSFLLFFFWGRHFPCFGCCCCCVVCLVFLPARLSKVTTTTNRTRVKNKSMPWRHFRRRGRPPLDAFPLPLQSRAHLTTWPLGESWLFSSSLAFVETNSLETSWEMRIPIEKNF